MDVTEIYEKLQRRDIAKVSLIEYYCSQGCVVLHVWQSPIGRLWYQPRYKLSQRTALADTVESARAKRTEDGLRIWRSRGGSLDDLIEAHTEDPQAGVGLSVQCNHVRGVVILGDQLAADADAATPGNPTRHTVSQQDIPGNVIE